MCIAAREPKTATFRFPLRRSVGCGGIGSPNRHPRLLFPAEGRDHKQSSISKAPIETSTIQSAMKKVVSDSRIVAVHESRRRIAFGPRGRRRIGFESRWSRVRAWLCAAHVTRPLSKDPALRLDEFQLENQSRRGQVAAWVCLGWTYWLVSGHVSQDPPPSLAVVRFAACGQSMRVVGVTNSSEVLSNHALAYLDSG